MSEHDPLMEPFPQAVASLLEVERTQEPVPSDVRSRLHARLARELFGPPDGGSDGGAAPTGSEGQHTGPAVPTGAARGLTPIVLAATFALGGLIGAGSYALLAPRPAPEVRVREVRVEVPVPVTVQQERIEGPEPVLPARLGADRPHVDPSPHVDPRPSPPGLSREAERALLTRAQVALARQRPSDALAALTEHRDQYRRGAFVEERDALHVQALAASGRAEQATRAAEAFLARYPQSIFREAVEQVLE